MRHISYLADTEGRSSKLKIVEVLYLLKMPSLRSKAAQRRGQEALIA